MERIGVPISRPSSRGDAGTHFLWKPKVRPLTVWNSEEASAEIIVTEASICLSGKHITENYSKAGPVKEILPGNSASGQNPYAISILEPLNLASL